MTGINKRSNDPKGDQKKITVNPMYNTSMILKGVVDQVNKVLGPNNKKKK